MTKARDISKLLSTANGKIAGANLDVSFENISDTGTQGTKVASGTTGQRGSTAGQIRFNTTTGLAEYYDGTNFKSIDAPPTVTAVSPLEVDSTAGGNVTFTITGTNFGVGAVAKFIGNDATEITASTTTVTNSTTISAVIAKSSFVGAKEPYDVKIINGSSLSATLDNQINVDVSPAWSTASGTLATITDVATGTHATVSATDADGDTVSYSETGGTVLTTAGLTLNSSTGAISGNPTDVGSSTTYSFNLRATANSKTVDRAFNIIVNPALDGTSSARANTSAQAINTLTGTTTNGLYWIKDSLNNTQQVYCDMSATNGKWMLVASNNWNSTVLPAGTARNNRAYQIDRNNTLGALGTASPDTDYLIGSLINNLTFQHVRILSWGRDSTDNTYSFNNRGTWDEAVWQLSSNTGSGRFTEAVSSANVTYTNNVFARNNTSGTGMYLILDTAKWCQDFGISPNENQFTTGASGQYWSNAPSNPNSGTYGGSWLGHGVTEGNGEGFYRYTGVNTSDGASDAQGYTTWVK
jgi:hypothetical protein